MDKYVEIPAMKTKLIMELYISGQTDKTACSFERGA